ncbi:MAG: hypothetical protein ABSE56_02460 [Bryobacteraceae bacterium]|jgi:hypothetical protein
MTDQPVKITRISEVTAIGADRTPQTMLRVEFTVGTHGPFSEMFPKAGFSPEAARAKLEEFARGLQRMMSQ